MARFLREQSFDEYTSSRLEDQCQRRSRSARGDRTGLERTAVGRRAPGRDDQRHRRRAATTSHLFAVGQPVSQRSAVGRAHRRRTPATSAASSPPSILSNGDDVHRHRQRRRRQHRAATRGGRRVPVSGCSTATSNSPPTFPTACTQASRRDQRRRRERRSSAPSQSRRTCATFPIDYDVSETPPGRDTVDYFLFDLQRGYFDYHASAMAVMLRTLGVPARVATGYVIDPLAQDGAENTYELTQKHAYAWPEVYFPGIGWVEFSPTPTSRSSPAARNAPPAGGGHRRPGRHRRAGTQRLRPQRP